MISTTRRTEIKMLNKLLLLFVFISLYFYEVTSCISYPNPCNRGKYKYNIILTQNTFCAPIGAFGGCNRSVCRDCMREMTQGSCNCDKKYCETKHILCSNVRFKISKTECLINFSCYFYSTVYFFEVPSQCVTYPDACSRKSCGNWPIVYENTICSPICV